MTAKRAVNDTRGNAILTTYPVGNVTTTTFDATYKIFSICTPPARAALRGSDEAVFY